MKILWNRLFLMSAGVLLSLGCARANESSPVQGNNPPTIPVAQAQAETKLAQELQGKPVFVQIYHQDCPTCKAFKSTLPSLQQQYRDSVNFIVFDISTQSTTQAAAGKAAQLGLSNFFNTHRSQGGTIAIFNPSTGEVLTQYRRNLNKADYVKALDSAIASTKASQ
jgi:thiol-disulfide isomerase/thioredoxin